MRLASRKGLERFYRGCDTWRSLLSALRQAPPLERNQPLIDIVALLLEKDEQTIDCVENRKPLLSSWYGSAPEIYAAMDLHAITPVDNILQHLAANAYQDLEDCDSMAIPEDVCSLLRLSSYAVKAGHVPTPSAVIAMMQPCDGMRALHESYANDEVWGRVPTFALDSVYPLDDSSGTPFAHFAGELRNMVSFLERQTGRRLDFDRLRTVIEESNRQFDLWTDYNELRRAVPCPGASFEGTGTFFILTQIIASGDPRATEILRRIVAQTEQRVRDGRGAVENEKIRIFWADIVPSWSEEISTWLAREWSANIVMDWQSFAPYTRIDTETEESMFHGLSRRALTEVMMIRQSGPVQTVLDDTARVVREYGIDCVLFPGHMGHKDQSGYIGFLRELCRDLRVPFLAFSSSLFDPRYASLDGIKDTISEFLAVHGLG